MNDILFNSIFVTLIILFLLMLTYAFLHSGVTKEEPKLYRALDIKKNKKKREVEDTYGPLLPEVEALHYKNRKD